MAGDVVNIKVCSPLKLRSGLTGKKPVMCHYSYNLPVGHILTRIMRYILVILLIGIYSCSTTTKSTRFYISKSDPIEGIVKYINEHTDVTNQLNVDLKALFKKDSSIFVVYIGKSENDYFKKWEIPLDNIDVSTIEMNDEEFSGHPLYFESIDEIACFKYFENNSFEKHTSKFYYYPGAENGSKPRFRKKFKRAFELAVELVKKSHNKI